jgi:aryl-alcohol dehydrogenase-like predicted oxidoreductase
LAWLRSKPVVAAPLVGANTTGQIDDAVASLEVELTEADITALDARRSPRFDFQGVSSERELQAIRERVAQMQPTG